MNIEDIYVVDFTETEKKEAREWAEFLRTKNKGMKTVRVSPDQDVTGYLGHTAIERVFDDFGIPYLSTKKQRFTHGDAYDIEVKGCFVDSKSHKLAFNDKYFLMKNCLCLAMT